MDERARLEQKLLWKGYRYFTLSRPLRQPVGPLRYELIIYADQRNTQRSAALAGTYVEVLGAIGRLPQAT
ncbi:MAG TPA: hypothetical protein VIL85_08820 [Thermomicrobiales bacterium]|jgi:hypothetical protein